jgi:hypothetical protein
MRGADDDAPPAEAEDTASSASLPLDGASLLRFKQHLETAGFKREPDIEAQLSTRQRTWLISLLLLMLVAAYGIGSSLPSDRHHFVDAYNCGGTGVAPRAPCPGGVDVGSGATWVGEVAIRYRFMQSFYLLARVRRRPPHDAAKSSTAAASKADRDVVETKGATSERGATGGEAWPRLELPLRTESVLRAPAEHGPSEGGERSPPFLQRATHERRLVCPSGRPTCAPLVLARLTLASHARYRYEWRLQGEHAAAARVVGDVEFEWVLTDPAFGGFELSVKLALLCASRIA